MVGVGGVVIREGRALLIRRGSEPLKGEWSIPGGMLEVGETIAEGIARELREETGLQVRTLELIEVFERIFPSRRESQPHGDFDGKREKEVSPAKLPVAKTATNEAKAAEDARPLYHFVIIDYLCEAPEGAPRAGDDVTDVAFAAEDDLARFQLSPAATRVVKKAFVMARART